MPSSGYRRSSTRSVAPRSSVVGRSAHPAGALCTPTERAARATGLVVRSGGRPGIRSRRTGRAGRTNMRSGDHVSGLSGLGGRFASRCQALLSGSGSCPSSRPRRFVSVGSIRRTSRSGVCAATCMGLSWARIAVSVRWYRSDREHSPGLSPGRDLRRTWARARGVSRGTPNARIALVNASHVGRAVARSTTCAEMTNRE